MTLQDMWEKAQAFLQSFSAGEKMDDGWKSDASLRDAIEKARTLGSDADIAGDLFLEDLKEFLGGLDRYNTSSNTLYPLSLVVREEIEGTLATAMMQPRTSRFGYTDVGGLGLERNGRVYRGEYFNDLVLNTGFVFQTPNAKATFYCGLPKKADFQQFANKLFHEQSQVYSLYALMR